jgi:predicted DNA-binding transcriptional regulator AlpA
MGKVIAPIKPLTGMKEIAAFLGVNPLTIWRWSKKKGFPLHHGNGKGSTVYALSEEITEWLKKK